MAGSWAAGSASRPPRGAGATRRRTPRPRAIRTSCGCSSPTVRAPSPASPRPSGAARISIRDLTLGHRSTEAGGYLEIVVDGATAADAAVDILDAQGYAAIAAPLEEHQGEGEP